MSISFVYTLISSYKDYYLEQAFVSMHSLRSQMPDANIILLTDKETEASFTGTRLKEIQYANEIIALPLDNEQFTAKQRSRILKSSVRQIITGDYLYIDCDTIIVKPLDAIVNTPHELAACMDSHSMFIDNPYRWLCLMHGHLLNWPIEKEDIYYNSGVIYSKDCPVCHEFYNNWKRNLIDGFSKDVDMDQPSFAKTNYEMGHPVKTLDDIWNCELKHGIRYLKDAKIVHYLTTNISPQPGTQLFRLNETDLFDVIKKTGEIPEELLLICQDPFKGISSPTHCFSGDDIYFFQTPFYRDLSKNKSFKSILTDTKEQPFFQSDLYHYFDNHYPSILTKVLEKLLYLSKWIKRIK